MRTFLAHFLFVLAAWTLTIKYAFPVVWALAEGTPPLGYVWWDFWWVAHLWLGWALLARPGYLFRLALAVAVVEVIIVVSKFVLFLGAPEWTIWTTNWFINKVFVLGVFVLMLTHMALAPGEYRARRDPAGGAMAASPRLDGGTGASAAAETRSGSREEPRIASARRRRATLVGRVE